MLQRIQSIWLFLASVCAFASLRFPIFTGLDPLTNQPVSLDGQLHFPIMLVTIAIGVISLINIFLYSNRTLQFRLCLLAIVLEAALLYLYFREISQLINGTYALASVFQAGILFFLFAAMRGIRKDEKLIRESNRLR